MNDLYRDVVAPFYLEALTVNTTANCADVLNRVLAEDFKSHNNQEVKDKATLIKQVGFFWQLIRGLKWDPREVITSGNTVVVRSLATGAPRGMFMGLQTDGSKSFAIDTIDIHTVGGGRIVKAYHLEDWATAMRQLKT